MAKALIVYYSRSGNTKKMAESIAEGIIQENVSVDIRDAKDIMIADLLAFDAIIVGSPTYYGSMASDIKRLFDDSVSLHGKLDGKIGAAFTSSHHIGGGNETTILDILHSMLIHGMIVQGDWKGDHYGPVAIGAPDERTVKECLRLGNRIAQSIKQCHKSLSKNRAVL